MTITGKKKIGNKEYELRFAQTNNGISVQAFLGDRPAGPPVSVDYEGWQLDQWEVQGGSKNQVLLALLESAVGYVVDSLKES